MKIFKPDHSSGKGEQLCIPSLIVSYCIVFADITTVELIELFEEIATVPWIYQGISKKASFCFDLVFCLRTGSEITVEARY